MQVLQRLSNKKNLFLRQLAQIALGNHFAQMFRMSPIVNLKNSLGAPIIRRFVIIVPARTMLKKNVLLLNLGSCNLLKIPEIAILRKKVIFTLFCQFSCGLSAVTILKWTKIKNNSYISGLPRNLHTSSWPAEFKY